MTVDMVRVVKKIRETSGFVLQVMLVRSLGVSLPCALHISCGT